MELWVLEQALEESFDYSDKRQGRSLYQKNVVSELKIHRDQITAKVKDGYSSYEVVFELEEYALEDYVDFDGECTCPVMFYCKHKAAVLYRAIEQLKQNENQSSKTSKFPPHLPGSHSDEYRELPLDAGINYALNRYAPKRYNRLGWNEKIQGKFLSKSEIEIQTFTTHHYGHYRGSSILVKFENGNFFVKCQTCNSKIKTLCEHQIAILASAGQTIQQYFNGLPDSYDNILAEGAKQLNISTETLLKYFDMSLLPSGMAFLPKEENIVNDQWLQGVKDLGTQTKAHKKDFITTETERLTEGREQQFAFFWTIDNDRRAITGRLQLFFQKGKSYKSKPGIRDVLKNMSELPKGFPPTQQELGQQLFFLNQIEDAQERFEKIKNLIEENREQFNEIYNYTCNESPHEYRVKISDTGIFEFDSGVLEGTIRVEKKDEMIQVARQITLDGQSFDFKKIKFQNELFCADQSSAYLFPNFRFHELMLAFPPEHDSLIMPNLTRLQATELVNEFKPYFNIEVANDLLLEKEILTNPQFQILLREAGNFVLFEPRLKYGDHSFNAFDEESDLITEDKLVQVDETDRQYLVDFLKKSHPEFQNEFQVQEYVYIDIREMMNNYWFAHFNEACEAAGIEVLGQKDLSKFKYSKHRAQTYMHIKSGIDWFDVDAGISFGKEKVKTSDWIRALRNRESFVTLKDGTIGMLPEEWLEKARKVIAVADVEKGNLKISKYRFNVVDELFEDIDDKKIIKELQEKKQRLAEYDTNKKYKVPKIIKAKLRDYQKHGFAWLKFLDESGFGGILADDMGLGKTLQVITLLADQIKEPTSMVIVPRSLLFNWAAELDKFCPKLTYKIHHGQGRAKKLEDLLPLNIIITTYGTAAIDVEIFKDYEFNYIILDESQAIKNPDSKRYKAMRLLQSRNKLAMTGTPIENNTFDLYAQLSFTSPGLLGSKSGFKTNFSIPIDTRRDEDAANLLRKLTHPFILRRTKQQVAKDLPEKTETIIYCEMNTAQRKLYDKLKAKVKQDLEEAIEEQGVAKSRFQMLDGLLRLRQMCNSPLLVNNSFTGANAESVKINTLIENLTEALDQKHNALVFSQFVSLLKIVRKELDKRKIKYAYLDGSTTKRQAEVDKFMNDDEIKIFLISIKAGNTGMNLTKADYVYILDPWWNPAVEAQAIDRTHRIGQKNQIFAYKLICKNTIEEKILKLQEKKKSLADDIIRTDENVLKSLEKKELMALFD